MSLATPMLGRVTGRITGRLDRLSDRQYALFSFLPGTVLLVIVLIPIVSVFVMSLFRIELLKDDLHPFVGLKYFRLVGSDENFIASVPRTLVFAAGTTVTTVPLALAAALLMNQRFRGISAVGIAVLMPWAVAPVVTGLYWKFIFNSHFGLATGILMALHVVDRPVPWLDSSSTAMGVAMVATSWRSVPLLALILLAALKSIPDSQYRAARMDGATGWGCFRFITLPALRNTLLVVGILQVILSLQVFDVLFTLTHGGPGHQTTVIVYYIFESAFQFLSFGYSAALAIVLLGLIIACSSTLLYFRLRREPEAAEDDHSSPRLKLGTGSLPVAAVFERAPRRPRLRMPRWTGRTARTLGGALLLTWLVGPIAWIAIASVQPEGAVTTAPPELTPLLTLKNYVFLLRNPDWQQSIGVSLQTSLLTTFFTIGLASLAAYPLARLDIPGKGAIMSLLIFTQMIPAIVLAIPILLMVQAAHLKDTVTALVIVDTAFWVPLVVWLLRNVFEDVPRALEAAARIDGCSRLGTLFRVTIPAAAPGIAAIAILILIGTWNEFLFAVTIGDLNAVTVTRRIGYTYTIGGTLASPPYTLVAAAGFLAVLPCLALVVLFHRRVVAGLTGSFGKG